MHYRDVYVKVIGNRVRSLMRTPRGQYQVCAMDEMDEKRMDEMHRTQSVLRAFGLSITC